MVGNLGKKGGVGERAEGRGQKTEDGGWRAEDRRRRTEGRRRRVDAFRPASADLQRGRICAPWGSSTALRDAGYSILLREVGIWARP